MNGLVTNFDILTQSATEGGTLICHVTDVCNHAVLCRNNVHFNAGFNVEIHISLIYTLIMVVGGKRRNYSIASSVMAC